MTCQVSVCIPAYQEPELAARAVGSALDQVGCDIEVVVTDDSPDDRVRQGLAPFLLDRRLKYFRNEERLGAINNWNEALRRSSGAVKKVLHHDDWFAHQDALRRFVDPIASGHAKIVFSACNERTPGGGSDFVRVAPPEQIDRLRKTPRLLALGNFIGAPSVIAFHASLQERFNPKYLWVSDVDFYVRLIEEAGGDFIYVDEALLNIGTLLPSQLSRECQRERLRSFYEHADLISAQRFSGDDRKSAVAALKTEAEALSLAELLSLAGGAPSYGPVGMASELQRLAKTSLLDRARALPFGLVWAAYQRLNRMTGGASRRLVHAVRAQLRHFLGHQDARR